MPGLPGLPVAVAAPWAQPSQNLGSCEPQHRSHGAQQGLWVDEEDSQDRRRAALLTILVQVQVVTWKDRRCHRRWQDPQDRARALSPGGADTASASSRAHSHGNAAAARARATLG